MKMKVGHQVFHPGIEYSFIKGFKKRYGIKTGEKKPGSKEHKEAGNEMMERILYDWIVHQQMNNASLSGRDFRNHMFTN